MKPTIEQIDAAIDVINGDWLIKQTDGNYKINYVGFTNAIAETHETILFALRFTKKMMGEPSDEMGLSLYTERKQTSGVGRRYARSDWQNICRGSKRSWMASIKAMVNQAIKEVEDV